jgi:hypothetical protein
VDWFEPEGSSQDDLELMEQCRQIDSLTWFRVAQWDNKSRNLHWQVAGTVRTVGQYALDGWERSPSAKQAKSAMEAYKAAESADALADTKKGSERRGDVRYA